jgi:hypothetical protein
VNRADTAKLLALVAAIDSRIIEEATIITWHQILADVTFSDAHAAVIEHKRESVDYLQPAHIVQRAQVMADRRAQAQHLELERALIRKPVPDALFGQTVEPGVELARYVTAAVRAAGSRPVQGVYLGRKRAGDVAAKAAREWLKAHREQATTAPDVPPVTCGRTMCRCTHGRDPNTGAVCLAGWIHDDRPPHPKSNGQVVRCPVCAPSRAKILADSPTLESAGKALRLAKER